MTPMTGVLEWKDTGSLGRTGRGDEVGVLPSMSMMSWSAWSSAWGWMRSQPIAYGTVSSSGAPNIRRTWTCWSGSRGGHEDDQRAGAPPL
ncbi:unnamed protein product [Bubo scandiacus]